MSRATEEALGGLHDLVAEGLADTLRNGVDKVLADGTVVKEKASPAYYAAAIKFLKDNGIDAPRKNPGLQQLAAALTGPALPVFSDELDLDEGISPQ